MKMFRDTNKTFKELHFELWDWILQNPFSEKESWTGWKNTTLEKRF